jgi:hypothetical protein
MDGTWKRVVCKSCVPKMVSYFVKRTLALPGSRPVKRSENSGSFGTDHTGTNSILFHVDGSLYFMHLNIT